MDNERLTGSSFRAMLFAAANRLHEQRKFVDSLNVFPVPDGDTGTNMSSTILAAAKEVEKSGSDSVADLAAAAARGSLMGARGNSGVILSQFFRGFADGCRGHKELDSHTLAQAIQSASDTVYKAVMKPVEGTMLTVGRFAAEGANAAAESGANVWETLEAAFREAQKGLEKTPQLLPVLREAGVVDAGGQGLVVILEGVLSVVRGEGVPDALMDVSVVDHGELEAPGGITALKDLKYKYCTELIVRGTDLSTDSIRAHIEDWGDSLLVVGGGDAVKVHIHTNDPGRVLTYCSTLGDMLEIGIHNMAEQNRQAVAEREANQLRSIQEFRSNHSESADPDPVELKPVGLVAVCVGRGMAEIFTSLGADEVVVGGKTMNPSTEDLVSAINRVPAESVVLLPNNKNVLFAAQQAVELAGKPVKVVPTRTIPQGISAAMAFDLDASLDENYDRMKDAADMVATGEVTYAVRSTKTGNLDINEKDIIGLADGEIRVAARSIDEVGIELLKLLVDEDKEIISIYYGEQINADEANAFLSKVEETFPDLEVELHDGGQPLYYYVFGVE